MERWLGFVFYALKEWQPDAVEIRTFPNGETGCPVELNAMLTLPGMSLFRASALAIELWGLSAAPCGGASVQQPPDSGPAAGPAAEPAPTAPNDSEWSDPGTRGGSNQRPVNGPYAFGCFRWGEALAEGIPADQWRLLACLFDGEKPIEDVVPDEDLIEAVYGQGAEGKEEALKSLRRRLEETLAQHNIRGEVERPRKGGGLRFRPLGP